MVENVANCWIDYCKIQLNAIINKDISGILVFLTPDGVPLSYNDLPLFYRRPRFQRLRSPIWSRILERPSWATYVLYQDEKAEKP